ncbi:MAG: 1-acyl-sn-glycerol-3-phosphate acyltransferase [Candidatus Omnitrophica bacterium]|nr:1-acyl-sn-glycerol-3-phosphate acyltransferase [Candidatus Omnitrophota bacterium]
MWYWIFRAVFILILKLFFNFKVSGRENLPKNTNFIVVSNHTSFMDALVVGAGINKRTYWIAYRGLYRIKWLRWFFSAIGVIPNGCVSRKVISLLTENKNVGLFPEGKVSRDGSFGAFRRGVALLALKTGRPIVPCVIRGTYQALPYGAKFPRFSEIEFKIGRPQYLLKESGDVIDDTYLQEGIFRIRKAMKEMLYA